MGIVGDHGQFGGAMKATDFKPGERVRYIPYHARLDAERYNTHPKNHPDCKDGIVQRIGSIFKETVFVVYDNREHGVMDTLKAAEKWTAAGTNPNDLVKL